MDFTVRAATSADADACAAIHVAAWEGSYRGILPDEEFEKRPLPVRQIQWRQWFERPDHVTLAACDSSGAVIGFAGALLLDGEQTPFDSYLAMLYLRPDLKGKGIGRALIGAIAQKLQAAGAKSMLLRTLRENTARGFYEKLGARFMPEGIDFEAGHFDDVVYAFDDLGALARYCA